MRIRFYIDPEIGLPHIFGHGVAEIEVEQVMRGSGEDFPRVQGGEDEAREDVVGASYLQVIYAPDKAEEGIFVITAYELKGKAKTAYRRRQRRKPR